MVSSLSTLNGEDDTLLLAPTSARRGQTPQLRWFFLAGGEEAGGVARRREHR